MGRKENIEDIARKRVKYKKEFRKSLKGWTSFAVICLVMVFAVPGVAKWMLFALAISGVSLFFKGRKYYKEKRDWKWEQNEYQKELQELREISEREEEKYELEELKEREKIEQRKQRGWSEDDLV